MAEEDKEKRKKELLGIVNKVEDEASVISSKGRDIVKQGEFIGDVSRYFKQFLETIPDDGFFSPDIWDAQTRIWQNSLSRAKIYKDSLGNPSYFALTAYSTATSSATIITSGAIANLPPGVQVVAQKAYEGFEQTLEHANTPLDINAEIGRLGLTVIKGKETISSLLFQADEAFTTPSIKGVAPSAVLIPLREAINLTYSTLLQRRPLQEPAKTASDKIYSICRQCGDVSTDSAQIDFLAKEASHLNDQLSGAKQDSMSRDAVRELLNRGLIYLRTLMRTIDANKLK